MRAAGWLACLACLAATAGCGDPEKPKRFEVRSVTRCAENPLVTPESGAPSDNLNGPSPMPAPSWVESPLGDYYLYFADHLGTYIRLAYADELCGPWTVYEPGTLRLEQTQGFIDHIASPDVHLDEEGERVLMYFHGWGDAIVQQTGFATSPDGTSFTHAPLAGATFLSESYLRVFLYDGEIFGLQRGTLMRSEAFDQPFTVIKEDLVPGEVRHAAVLRLGRLLLVFFTRVGDAPERILLSTVELDGEPSRWHASDPIEILRPELAWEGSELPVAPSVGGEAVGVVNQLRDPGVIQGKDGAIYLFYSYAGESGLAAARVEVSLPD